MPKRTNMKIQINITQREANHLKSPHTFYDECERACIVLRKVQKDIDKRPNRRAIKEYGNKDYDKV